MSTSIRTMYRIAAGNHHPRDGFNGLVRIDMWRGSIVEQQHGQTMARGPEVQRAVKGPLWPDGGRDFSFELVPGLVGGGHGMGRALHPARLPNIRP